MTPEALRLLFDYHYWAFDRVWDCVWSLSEAQFTQEIDYSIGSIRNHLVHVMAGTQRWIYRLRAQEAPDVPAYDDYPTRAAVRAKWDALKTEMLDYVHSLDQAQLNERIRWTIAARGINCDNYRWELLLHVANHGTDHRAQMLALMNTQFGVQTGEQDLVFYLIQQARE